MQQLLSHHGPSREPVVLALFATHRGNTRETFVGTGRCVGIQRCTSQGPYAKGTPLRGANRYLDIVAAAGVVRMPVVRPGERALVRNARLECSF